MIVSCPYCKEKMHINYNVSEIGSHIISGNGNFNCYCGVSSPWVEYKDLKSFEEVEKYIYNNTKLFFEMIKS